MTAPDLPRRLVAELVGTALLVTVVVGSGIAAQRLSPDDVGLQLLQNSTATVLGLTVLILLFGPVSGAHFNPVVSAADWLLGRRTRSGLSGAEVAPLQGGPVDRALPRPFADDLGMLGAAIDPPRLPVTEPGGPGRQRPERPQRGDRGADADRQALPRPQGAIRVVDLQPRR